VPDSSAMLTVVAAAEPAKTATLKLLRNGNEVTMKLTVGKRPKPKPRQEDE
jgi:serine protease DegQ